MVAAIDRKDSRFDVGDLVRVSKGDRHVIVEIVTSCLCKSDRIIDLTAEAFSRLSPDQTKAGKAAFLDRGEVGVRLSQADAPVDRAGPTLPPTDVAVTPQARSAVGIEAWAVLIAVNCLVILGLFVVRRRV
jgi:rare lipoprotein A (peptidoglycan hydrolase)